MNVGMTISGNLPSCRAAMASRRVRATGETPLGVSDHGFQFLDDGGGFSRSGFFLLVEQVVDFGHGLLGRAALRAVIKGFVFQLPLVSCESDERFHGVSSRAGLNISIGKAESAVRQTLLG